MLVSNRGASTTTAHVTDAIRRLILRRGLQPGDQLPTEREFAQHLGVSRTAVREAFSQLAALGVIESRRGRGTFLRQTISPSTHYIAFPVSSEGEPLLAVLEVRRALEDLAVRLAAQRALPDDLHRLEAIWDEFQARTAKGFDPAEVDWEFHVAIYRAAHNPVLMAVLESIFGLFHRFWENPLQIPGFAHRTHPLHGEILQHIRDRDPDGASAVLQRLLDIVEEDIRNARPAQQP